MGHMDVAVPRSREQGSPADVLGRYRRWAEEIDDRIAEAYVGGVSQRKMADVPEALMYESVGRSTVSRVAHRLDKAVDALGNEAESDAVLDQLIEEHSSGWAYNIAYVYAYRGQVDAAFDWLDLAVDYQDSGLATVAVRPLLANLSGDPRGPRFLERLGRSKDHLNKVDFRVSFPD